MAGGLVLAQGEIFEITGQGRVLTCVVVNRTDVTPEVGARCAAEMSAGIERELLAPTARHRGLVFDVRRGPPAFGPKTRASLGTLFGDAERLSRRVAALVGGSATQKMQFSSLSREFAPTQMRVFDSPDAARAWAAGDPT